MLKFTKIVKKQGTALAVLYKIESQDKGYEALVRSSTDHEEFEQMSLSRYCSISAYIKKPLADV